MSSKLEKAKGFLLARQAERVRHGRHGDKCCLGDVRAAVGSVGLRLPWRPFPWNTAIDNFRALVGNPGKYGWKQVHSPLEKYGLELVYFKGCGVLNDGRTAGHIAILDCLEGKHYANATWQMTPFWADRLVGAFVPLRSEFEG